jgi:predicted methyltransferase
MSNEMKFTKTTAGTYTSGRWTITRTYCWELHLDGCKVMGYTSIKAAKAGAAEYAANMVKNLDAA